MVPLNTNVTMDLADLFDWFFGRSILFKTKLTQIIATNNLIIWWRFVCCWEHSSDDESCCSCSRNIFHSSFFFFDLCGCFCLIFVGVSFLFFCWILCDFFSLCFSMFNFFLSSIFFSVFLCSQFFLSTGPLLLLFILWLFLVLACFFE